MKRLWIFLLFICSVVYAEPIIEWTRTYDNARGQDQFSALLTDADGEKIWWRTYGKGICHALIELKSAEYPTGLYFGVLTAGDKTYIRKITLVR